MAKTVAEIMNPELFSIRPSESIESARICIVGLGLTSAPVVDDLGRPLGMLSLRDVLDGEKVDERPGDTAAERMSEPAVVVRTDASIGQAAELLAHKNLHHVAVVDERGVGVGFLSALDVIRGLAGLPISHPASFPHLDKHTGVAWSDDLNPRLEDVRTAPDRPGVWILIQGGRCTPRTIVWAEAAANVCSRLIDLVSLPQQQQALAQLLTHDNIRIRAAAVDDSQQRARVLELVQPQSSPLKPAGAS